MGVVKVLKKSNTHVDSHNVEHVSETGVLNLFVKLGAHLITEGSHVLNEGIMEVF